MSPKVRISPGPKKGPSLSVRQLVDERIEKLETAQRQEIDAEYDGKMASLQQSLRLKTMKLENDLQGSLHDNNRAHAFSQSLFANLKSLEEILSTHANTLGKVDSGDLGITNDMSWKTSQEIYLSLNRQLAEFEELVEKKIAKELAAEEMVYPLVACSSSDVEHSVISEILKSVNSISAGIESIEGPSKNAFEPGTRADSFEQDDLLNKVFSKYAVHSTPASPTQVSHLETLIHKLSSWENIEHEMDCQIEASMSKIDEKYLKVCAQASSTIYTESSSGVINRIDPFFSRKVLPWALKDNERLTDEVASTLSEYMRQNMGTNSLIERIYKMERNRVIR